VGVLRKVGQGRREGKRGVVSTIHATVPINQEGSKVTVKGGGVENKRSEYGSKRQLVRDGGRKREGEGREP